MFFTWHQTHKSAKFTLLNLNIHIHKIYNILIRKKIWIVNKTVIDEGKKVAINKPSVWTVMMVRKREEVEDVVVRGSQCGQSFTYLKSHLNFHLKSNILGSPPKNLPTFFKLISNIKKWISRFFLQMFVTLSKYLNFNKNFHKTYSKLFQSLQKVNLCYEDCKNQKE